MFNGRALLVIVVAIGGAVLLAQPSVDAKRTWEQLSPAERATIERRYDLWKKLPPEQRERLRERQEVLRELLSESQRTTTEAPPQQTIGEYLKRRGAEILAAAGWTAEEIESQQFDEFVGAARKRALDRIRHLEADGVIGRIEAERLRNLPPPKLGREINQIEKRRILSNPPQRFLELEPLERARLEVLPPGEFMREFKRLVPPPPRGGQAGPQGNRAPRGPRPHMPPNPRFLAVKKWLEINASPADHDEFRRAEPLERRRVIRDYLRSRARESIAGRGGDPSWLDEVDLLPNEEREVRLIQLIDPNFTPPPMPER